MIPEIITCAVWAGLLAVGTSIALDLRANKYKRVPSYFFLPMFLSALLTYFVFGLPYVVIPLLVLPFLASILASIMNIKMTMKGKT
jgi:hypothetical protein